MKRKTTWIIIFSLLAVFKIFAASERIRISQIKIVIDEIEFSWKEEGITGKEEAGDLRLQPETVLSFTNLKPGKKISLKNLERETKETELRILNSGLVYSAKAVVLPARKNPEKRSVLIKVQSGFFPRFGGGGIYGIYGRAGLGGKRMEVLGYAGWNVNGASWKYENAFNLPLIFGTSLFWNGPAAFLEEENFSAIDGLFTAGFFMGPDNRVCLDLNTGYSFGKNYKPEEIILKPYFRSEKYLSEKLHLDFCTQTVINPFNDKDFFDSWDTVGAMNWNLNSNITQALSAGGGMGNCNLSGYEKGLSSNLSFINMMIRSGYAEKELKGSGYIYAAAETRWNAKTVVFSPVIQMKIQPFFFADLAVINRETKEALGFGTRLLLDNPVFAYFTFSYGMNLEGNGKFIFTATKGF